MADELQLTESERGYLDSARRQTQVRYALEEYSRLWDAVDARLGDGNDTTKLLVREYRDRESREEIKRPDNPEDARRVSLMEASYLMPRILPKDVASALLFSSIFGDRR